MKFCKNISSQKVSFYLKKYFLQSKGHKMKWILEDISTIKLMQCEKHKQKLLFHGPLFVS